MNRKIKCKWNGMKGHMLVDYTKVEVTLFNSAGTRLITTDKIGRTTEKTNAILFDGDTSTVVSFNKKEHFYIIGCMMSLSETEKTLRRIQDEGNIRSESKNEEDDFSQIPIPKEQTNKMNEKISAHIFNPETQFWDQVYGAILYDQNNVFFYYDRELSIGSCLGNANSMNMRLLKKGMFLYTFIISSPFDNKTTELKADRFTGKKILSAIK